MNYRKLLAKAFERRGNNNAAVATALIAGLAAGAALGVLFAPEKGSGVRRRIGDKSNSLAGSIRDLCHDIRLRVMGIVEEEIEEVKEVKSQAAKPRKKPKSDIREIVHDAHADSQQQQSSDETSAEGENS